ncbi:MAG: NFYB/HAP3 family transcription factor subunit [Candidatus Micrarchaeaceae archaeon]
MGERAYSLYDIERFIREAGAEKVTEDAVLNLEKELEKLTELVTERAKAYARHAGRNTLIRKSDVLLANQKYQRRPPSFIRNASTTKANSTADK